ncbi:uncharacterized protein BJX67DRAFT_381764 [Aspergillus lucknowensis]|uniref:Uncharacterized protein n=1 Tax=Aspergillus lucknowensis TaxID=176173 RepID=A0ABR4LPR3_9EURO
MFGVKHDKDPDTYWRVKPSEFYLSGLSLLKNYRRADCPCFQSCEEEQSSVRLFIDTVLLDVDVLNTIKDKAGQYEMGSEAGISYILPTDQLDSLVIMKVTGRMDYNVWYGQPSEAETNLLVVKAKQKSGLLGGRYQVITYMGKSIAEIRGILYIVDTSKLLALIQRARLEAGHIRIPIYGIATDSDIWDFMHIDLHGNVHTMQLNWHATDGAQIVPVLHEIIRAASALTRAPTRELAREQALIGQTSLTLTDLGNNLL